MLQMFSIHTCRQSIRCAKCVIGLELLAKTTQSATFRNIKARFHAAKSYVDPVLDSLESFVGFDGFDRGDHLWFDTPTFIGKSWETQDGVVLLNLQRKDEPGAHFVEVIIIGDGGQHRARTWHWFKDGQLYRRTLCDEVRVA